jgi:cold shock CspA family protein
MYIPFTDLNVGFANAENYQRPENKELLAKYFVRDQYLDRLLDPNIYFLVGEKGTGKTAYATFLRNSDYKDHKVSIFNVRQTEYQKFLELKKQGHLALSQYAEVWRTLLLISAATSILEKSGTPEFLKRFTKLSALKNAIDEYYENAFAPEIVKLISFIESSEVAYSLIAKYMGIGAQVSSKTGTQKNTADHIFQTNLLKIRQAFEAALKTVKPDSKTLVFIDGIDVRPGDISYTDYFECVRGLIEAIWAVNNDFLANIKDSKGIRIVLLVRPDIFLQTGLHNINTKLRDNSVFLNWGTTYKDYRGSMLFKIADRLLSAQQTSQVGKKVGDSWDYYFPFHAENVRAADTYDKTKVNSFLSFLRFSYYRPRDINSMVSTLKDYVVKKREHALYVTAEDFRDPTFRDAHAEYLLGEIRDQLLFYYSIGEYNLFLQFFSHLRGKQKFSFDEYIEAYNEFIIECTESKIDLPRFFETANSFLQFLYEQNVICYKEKSDKEGEDTEPFIRWCFRERTLSNMAPKVRSGVHYEIFYGLSKALNVGRTIKVSKSGNRREVGTIIDLNIEKGFGFIRGGERQIEYYFKISEYKSSKWPTPRISQKVSYEVYIKYGKPRALAITPAR